MSIKDIKIRIWYSLKLTKDQILLDTSFSRLAVLCLEGRQATTATVKTDEGQRDYFPQHVFIIQLINFPYLKLSELVKQEMSYKYDRRIHKKYNYIEIHRYTSLSLLQIPTLTGDAKPEVVIDTKKNSDCQGAGSSFIGVF